MESMKKRNLSLSSKSFVKNILPHGYIACFPGCSIFNLSYLGHIFLKDEKNSVLSFISNIQSINSTKNEVFH